MDKLSLLVGRMPATKRSAGIRRAIRQTLGEHPFLSVDFADDASRPDNVRSLIDMAFIILVDASRSRDDGAFLDLGYALGQRRYCVVLQGPRAADVAGFQGDHTVEYCSVSDLRETLERSVMDWIGQAIRKYTAGGKVFADMDARLIAPLGKSLLEGDLDDEFTTASGHGFSEQQVNTTLGILKDLGMVRAIETGWAITDSGRLQLPRLIAGMAS